MTELQRGDLVDELTRAAWARSRSDAIAASRALLVNVQRLALAIQVAVPLLDGCGQPAAAEELTAALEGLLRPR
jgi:hypothetical protein